MEKKNNSLRRIVSSSVLLGFLAILLCAPKVRADFVVLDGQTENIDYAVGDYLEIFGTANLYTGAYAAFGIYAYPGEASEAPGSTVNIYGCAPGNTLTVLKQGDIGERFGLPPVVTIYGSMFHIGPIETGASFSPPDDRPINDILHILDESNEELFSLWIWSDVDIHLRAPGSTEKERLEAELWVSPKLMYRQRRSPVVFATLRLPEGITKDDVDRDYRLMLYTEENEGGIEANCQRIYQSCRQETSRVKIFAFFNMARLLDGAADNCEEMQLQVCGRIKTGQEFYGSDTIRIINPHKRHWRSRVSMTNKYRHR